MNDINVAILGLMALSAAGALFREAFRRMDEQTRRDSHMREVEKYHRRRMVEARIKRIRDGQ